MTTALEGQKRYHVQKLLPFQGVVNRRHTIPRALPWANGSLPFQGVVNRTVRTNFTKLVEDSRVLAVILAARYY